MRNLAEKEEIRKKILSLRESMDKEEWEQKTRNITQKVTGHPLFLQAKEIYCYMDFRREAGTCGIIEKAWEMNKKVAIPKTVGKTMRFYYISFFRETSPGRFGILEPDESRPASGEEGLIVMPGAVFDHELHRIGYGGGFYDRYLEKHTGLLSMALAFEFQVLSRIPHEEHDIRPHVLVTEARIETRYMEGEEK